MAMTPEQRQARMDALKAEREARMAEQVAARAASNPMLDPSNRPEAPAPEDGFLFYYSWIGGATSGEWKLYRAPNTQTNIEKYGARAFGGETQQSGSTAAGANTLAQQPLLEKDQYGNIIGYTLNGRRIGAGSTTPPPGSTTPPPGSTTPPPGSTTPPPGSVTPPPGSTTPPPGTSTPTGLTQADVDAAIAKALAAQQAKFDALAAQQKAEADAAKLAVKVKAKDRLTTMFAAYGLESLAGFIDRRIMADASEEQVLLELYDQQEYKNRFPGMAALRKLGRTITEKEYMANERAMTQTARFFDLPKGFYDSPADFGDLLGKEVSPKEYQDRLQVGQDLARTLNPSVKQQLIDFYGVGEGDLTAFVLDADKALPLIQKQAKAAQFVGIGRAAGFTLGGMTARQAENIAGTESYAKLSEAELSKALGAAGQLRSTQERLARLEGVTYNEQEALSAVIEGNQTALLASQQRAQREAARFSTRGGVSGSTLRSTTAI
jgi:hypothetical protein